jgi:hypothetical protein
VLRFPLCLPINPLCSRSAIAWRTTVRLIPSLSQISCSAGGKAIDEPWTTEIAPFGLGEKDYV